MTTKISGNLVKTATLTGNNIAANTISATNIRSDVNIGGPTITSISYVGDNTAADTAGGETITLSGSGFLSGATVLIESVAVGSATVVNANTITFTTPAKSTGSYIVYVVNTDGSTAILVPGIQYSGTPTWSTAAGSLGTAYEQAPISASVSATGDGTISYSLASGTLPTGSTLNSNGQLSGTAPADTGSTTYTFTIRATDAQNQDTDRQFSVTINTDVVTWSAPANNATITTYEYVAISNTFAATSAAGRSVAYTADTLPANVTISGSTVSGTPTTVGNTTSIITATANVTTRTAQQTLNFVVQPDVVTWSSPANNETYTWVTGTANTVTLAATSAAGFGVSYSANVLPTGLSVSGNTITGTPTTAGNTTTLVTATAATTGRTATRTFNWVINLAGDTYWKNNTLLLSASATLQPNAFNRDASSSSNQLTIVGSPQPAKFNPYQEGYYSNYFDGSGDYLTITAPAFGTGDFTIEAWANPSPGFNVNAGIFGCIAQGGVGVGMSVDIAWTGSSSITVSHNWASSIVAGRWHHVAMTRQSGTVRWFLNGTLVNSATDTSNITNTTYTIGNRYSDNSTYLFTGYISNARAIKGTALYTASFTPSTTPLTADANTTILAARANRFIDGSPSSPTITRVGDVTVSPAHPFTQPSSDYGCAYFTSTSDYITYTGTTAQVFGTGDFTVECWIYATNTGTTTGHNISRPGTLANTWTLQTYNNAMNWLYGSSTIGTGAIPANVWTHLCVSRVSGVTKGFVNGTQTFSISDTNNYSASPTRPIGPGAGGSAAFCISDFKVVVGSGVTSVTVPTSPRTADSNTQILTMQYVGGANSSTFVDQSSFGNILARNGNPISTTFGPYGDNWSVKLDSSGDYFSGTLPAALGSNNFTFECWAYRNQGLTNDTIFSIDNTAFYVQFYTTYLRVWADVATTTYLEYNGVTDGKWYHIAFTRSGNTLRLFVDGTLRATGTSSTLNITGTAYRVGEMTGGGSNFWDGHISNMRIVKGTALYTSSFTAPTSPLSPVNDTILLTCQSNRLVDNSPYNRTLTRTGDTKMVQFSPFNTKIVPKYYSAYFDGTGDYMTFADNAAFEISGDFTVEAWFYATAFSTYNDIITKGASGIYQPYYIFTNSSGNLLFYSSSSGSAWDVASAQSFGTVSLNTWYHVAVSRQGSSLRMFLNGSLINTITNSSALYNNTRDVAIGARSDGSELFTGYISNARIVNGTAVYTTAFTPPTTPLTAISGTSLLTCQDNTLKDNSTNAFTATVNGDVRPLPISPFTPTAGDFLPYTASQLGGGLYFDGTGDNLLTGYTKVLYLNADFTIECWVYPTATGGMILNSGGGSGIAWASYEFVWDGTYVNFAASSANGGYDIGSETGTTGRIGAPGLNQWNHIAVTRSGNVYRGFLNGVQGYTQTLSLAPYDTTSRGLAIGSNYTTTWGSGTPTNTVTGYISDVRIIRGTAVYTSNFAPSSVPLTAIQNTSLLINGTNAGIFDASRRNTVESIGNAVVTSKSPYASGGVSYYFDGTGDWLHLLPSDNFEVMGMDFTVEFWFYTSSSSRQWFFHTATDYWFGIDYNSVNTNKLGLWASTNGTSWDMITSDSGGAGIGNTTLPLNQWNHIAVTRSNSGATATWRIFLNGAVDKTITTGNQFIVNRATQLKVIGSWAASSHLYPVNGYIADFRFTKGIARYTSAFTPPTTPLDTK